MDDNELPIKIKLETSLEYDDLNALINKRNQLSIAVVRVNDMMHPIVIVGYDPYEGGFRYLDPLYVKEDGLPDEIDFQENHGVSFPDAWQYTFVLEKVDIE
ncbi:MAG: hypothetical protein K8R77_16330 [Anaerolineaceae bacterium]|nr:hypothetical protein [Anaerolineaceae bacterium]